MRYIKYVILVIIFLSIFFAAILYINAMQEQEREYAGLFVFGGENGNIYQTQEESVFT